LLARDLDDAVRVAGKAFNAVKDERAAADYDEMTEEARDALRAASIFLAARGGRYGFRPSSP
jgi:hypothetical protein